MVWVGRYGLGGMGLVVWVGGYGLGGMGWGFCFLVWEIGSLMSSSYRQWMISQQHMTHNTSNHVINAANRIELTIRMACRVDRKTDLPALARRVRTLSRRPEITSSGFVFHFCCRCVQAAAVSCFYFLFSGRRVVLVSVCVDLFIFTGLGKARGFVVSGTRICVDWSWLPSLILC